MPIADNDILRITAKMLIGEDDVQNVYHMKVNVTGSPSDSLVVEEILDYVEDAYGDLVSSICSTVVFATIEVWNVTQDSLLGEDVWPSLIDGGNETNQLPAQCGALVLFNTGQARSQGRKFLPPFGTSSGDDLGTIITASLNNIILYANRLLVELTGTGFTGAMGNWNPVLVRFAEWTGNQVRDLFATQRRRYIGSGS